MASVDRILNEYWDNFEEDPFPRDRSMKIIDDKQIQGMSSENVRFLINKLAQTYAKDGVYLEVGIWRGCSLISAALFNPTTRCIGIDNFSLFNEDNNNENILKTNLKKFDELKNVEFYNLDYREALNLIFAKEPDLKVGTYFYDGPHAYEDQLNGLNMVVPHLASKCAIIVDDINRKWIEQANQDFLAKNPTFCSALKIKKANYPSNWWNGIEVMIRE
jgi:hypothetical protein